MKKIRHFYFLTLTTLIISSCSAYKVAIMTSTNMNKLDLGMSKEQVTTILGSVYTIAEKRIENDTIVEVISYRDFYRSDELYMFVFKNGKLEKWYRELVPSETTHSSTANSTTN